MFASQPPPRRVSTRGAEDGNEKFKSPVLLDALHEHHLLVRLDQRRLHRGHRAQRAHPRRGGGWEANIFGFSRLAGRAPLGDDCTT